MGIHPKNSSCAGTFENKLDFSGEKWGHFFGHLKLRDLIFFAKKRKRNIEHNGWALLVLRDHYCLFKLFFSPG